MIIKGGAAGNVGFWSSHLMRDDTNEKAEVRGIRGVVADNLKDALREMQAVASGSRSKGNFMYQANISPRAEETLTPDQWKIAVDTLEKNLGLTGHQRVVVEHIKNGRQHYHVVWNRVDVDTMRVTDIKGNYATHNRTSRELEQKFDLTPTPTQSPDPAKAKAPELWEVRQAERSGIDTARMKSELTELWHASDNGRAFKAAIEERGYILAKGDRRDFCVVDQAAQAHSLARRLDGVRAAEVREKMSDVDRDKLPTVAEAQEMQRNRKATAPAPVDEKELFQASLRIQWSSGQSHVATPANLQIPRSEISITEPVVKAAKVMSKIADMAISLLSGPTAPPRPEDIQLRSEQLLAQRREAAAWQAVRENIDQGRALTPEVLRQLGRNHLENIAASGDAYIMQVLAAMNRRERQDREHDRGRTRER